MSDVETVTISSKGQLAIPKALREQLGIREGSRLRIQVRNSKLVLSKVEDWRTLRGAAAGTNLLNHYEAEKTREKRREDRRR